MIFELSGSIIFEAEGIDDAMASLALIFLCASRDSCPIETLPGTSYKVEAMQEPAAEGPPS